jgi:hypothetical protein
MSPREVNSLNALAKAHGGHLTTNPHTGLPEAGFLESILPMAAGFALNAALPGSGMLVPALVGGGTALLTGSLEKGLMAGLGAYGGANIGEALASQGIEQATAQELAKDEALQTAQAQAAQTLNSQFGNVAANGIPAGQTDAYIKAVQAANAPGANLIQTAQTNALNNYNALDFGDKLKSNFNTLTSPGGASGLFDKVTSSPMSLLKTVGASSAPGISEAMKPKKPEEVQADASMGQRYAYSPGYTNPTPNPSATGQEQRYLNPAYRPISNEEAKKIYGFADGGTTPAANPAAPPVPTSYTTAEPSVPVASPPPAFSIPTVNSMADLVRAPESQGLVNAYLNRPTPIDVQSQFNNYLQNTLQSKPMAVANSAYKAPASASTTSASTDKNAEYIYDSATQQYIKNPNYKPTAEKKKGLNHNAGINMSGIPESEYYQGLAGMAKGGIADAHYNLGGYSDGGRLLKGPGDGVSDSIPAVIGQKQPARLADGEFVVPARIVSELGNGSTEAGARKLYAMMDRVQAARSGTVGKGKIAKNSRSEKYLPA